MKSIKDYFYAGFIISALVLMPRLMAMSDQEQKELDACAHIVLEYIPVKGVVEIVKQYAMPVKENDKETNCVEVEGIVSVEKRPWRFVSFYCCFNPHFFKN